MHITGHAAQRCLSMCVKEMRGRVTSYRAGVGRVSDELKGLAGILLEAIAVSSASVHRADYRSPWSIPIHLPLTESLGGTERTILLPRDTQLSLCLVFSLCERLCLYKCDSFSGCGDGHSYLG